MTEEKREAIRQSRILREKNRARDEELKEIASKVHDYLRSENITILEFEKLMEYLAEYVKHDTHIQ